MNKEIETENPQNDKLRFTTKDMLRAFCHGREFVPDGSGCDSCERTPGKNIPFWGWLSRYYGSRLNKLAEKRPDKLITKMRESGREEGDNVTTKRTSTK